MENTDEWNGVWWSDSLEDRERQKYETLVAKLVVATPKERPLIAREIFQLGHDHGYQLRADLAYDY